MASPRQSAPLVSSPPSWKRMALPNAAIAFPASGGTTCHPGFIGACDSGVMDTFPEEVSVNNGLRFRRLHLRVRPRLAIEP